jgi:hypothetical protein
MKGRITVDGVPIGTIEADAIRAVPSARGEGREVAPGQWQRERGRVEQFGNSALDLLDVRKE